MCLNGAIFEKCDITGKHEKYLRIHFFSKKIVGVYSTGFLRDLSDVLILLDDAAKI